MKYLWKPHLYIYKLRKATQLQMAAWGSGGHKMAASGWSQPQKGKLVTIHSIQFIDYIQYHNQNNDNHSAESY